MNKDKFHMSFTEYKMKVYLQKKTPKKRLI